MIRRHVAAAGVVWFLTCGRTSHDVRCDAGFQVLDLLQRQGRVSYRALKRRFDLDDAYLRISKPKSSRLSDSPSTRPVKC